MASEVLAKPTADLRRSAVPRLEVMMITVFLKSTVRPCESVRRPSSRICSSVLNTSGWAFSISSKSTTENGFCRHTSALWRAALVVANVSRRRADQAAHGVLLHVLGHVELDQGRFVTEQELGQRLGRL